MRFWTPLAVVICCHVLSGFAKSIDFTLFLNGKKLGHFYSRLHELPMPGKEGTVFEYYQFTQAYKSGNETGCVFDGVFYGINQRREEACSILECLPNSRNNNSGALIQKTYDCGPPGHRMMPHVCHVPTNGTSPPSSGAFPHCCALFECAHNYDPRRLVLPPESPIQGRVFSEVDKEALPAADPLDGETNTKPEPMPFRAFPRNFFQSGRIPMFGRA